MRNMTNRCKSLIKEFCFDGHDNFEDDNRLPTVLCSNCYTIINEYGRGIFQHSIDMFDYSTLGAIRPQTRSAPELCECYVCKVARSSSTSNFGSFVTPKKSSVPSLSAKPCAIKVTCQKKITLLL